MVDIPPGCPIALAERRMRGPWDRRLDNSDGVASASSNFNAVTVTASATPHAKGSWIELVAATTVEAGAVQLFVMSSTFVNGTDTGILLDLGVGGAGSEQVVIADIPCGWRQTVSGQPYPDLGLFPLRVPKGSRLAVRCQAVQVSDTADIGVRLRPPVYGRTEPRVLDTIGTDSANSRGTVLTIPGGTNTKSAWTEITSGTARPLCGFVVGLGGGGDTGLVSSNVLLDIGMGAAGAEQVIGADLHISPTSTEILSIDEPGVYAADIPKGTRLAARYAYSSAGTSLDVSLIGVPA